MTLNDRIETMQQPLTVYMCSRVTDLQFPGT
jgi:hypothetical protein